MTAIVAACLIAWRRRYGVLAVRRQRSAVAIDCRQDGAIRRMRRRCRRGDVVAEFPPAAACAEPLQVWRRCRHGLTDRPPAARIHRQVACASRDAWCAAARGSITSVILGRPCGGR